MKTKNGRMFKLGVVFFSLLVFLVSTGGALGVVWLRQQISRTAEGCMSKEKELVVLQRKSIYLQSMIAQVHNPEYLKGQVEKRLSMPSQRQIVWVNPGTLSQQNRYLASKSTKSMVLGGSQGNRVVQ